MTMDKTAIQAGTSLPKTAVTAGLPPTGTNGTPAAVSPEPAMKAAKPPVHPVYQLLVWLADLRITVVLFLLALVLVFWGTLAQTDAGVWTVVNKYFRTWIVWVPLKVVFFNQVEEHALKIPFPAGWLIGGVMLVNLLAAHAIRFKFAWNRAGILMIHAGIIIMMLGEFITGVYAIEGMMMIQEGQTANTVVDVRSSEIAIILEVNAKTDQVVVVPSNLLKADTVVDDAKVPFKIETIQFMINSKLHDVPNNKQATKGFGRAHTAEDLPEVSGVEVGQKVDTPSVYVKLTARDGADLGTWLFSTRFPDPQWVTLRDGTKYKVILRFKQTTRDFTMHLTKFDHKVFAGEPNKPKDYRSYIHLVDKSQDVDRDVEIYMNAPLYFRGETFYQSGMDKDDRGVITTTLSVVRNPGWLLPYLSCGIVGFGLLIHFGLTLYRFIDRRIVR